MSEAQSAIIIGMKERIAALEFTLEHILNWAKAYPLEVFPEPDMKKARMGLASVGITLDAVSASNMRHVITRLVEECALTQTEETK